MQKTSHFTLILKLWLVILCIDLYQMTFAQGRHIDMAITVINPKAGDTVVSRINGVYKAEFAIRNFGPDTVKTDDTYSIKASFGNVVYSAYEKKIIKAIPPNLADTIAITYPMIWDTDAPSTNFCGIITLKGFGLDSIKKESNSEWLNNKHCQSVTHDSRLKIERLQVNQVLIFPNPSKGVINIRTPSYEKIDLIKIINDLGQEQMTFEEGSIKNNWTLDLSYLEKGIYFVQIYLKNQRIMKIIAIN